jgi:hypothetical protein
MKLIKLRVMLLVKYVACMGEKRKACSDRRGG